MKAFTAPLLELAEFDTIQKTKYREPGMIQIAGSTGSQKGHLAYALAREDRRVLYVVQDEEKAKEILLEKEIDIPIIGVVKPGAKGAAEVTQNGKIGVIGTEGTIGSQIYTEYIHNINPDARVIGKACPLFCPLVEEGLWQDPVTDEIASRYLT